MKFSAQNWFQLDLQVAATAAKLCAATTILIVLSLSVRAQQTFKIDHLTVAEDDLIHETQELDKRVEIFVKAIDRRLIILNPASELKIVDQENKKPKKKDADKWGPPPAGTRTELLVDVKSILEEAVRNIDNAAEHNAASALLPKALKTLADGCSRLTVQLKPFYDSAQSETERAAVYDSTESCREIIEASVKHPVNTVK